MHFYVCMYNSSINVVIYHSLKSLHNNNTIKGILLLLQIKPWYLKQMDHFDITAMIQLQTKYTVKIQSIIDLTKYNRSTIINYSAN